MTSSNFQDLSEAQRQTAKALQSLLVQLRRDAGTSSPEGARTLAGLERSRTRTGSGVRSVSPAADLERVLRPLVARTTRAPASVGPVNVLPQTNPLLGAPSELQIRAGRAVSGSEDFAQAITTATRTAQNFGRLLSQNTQALLQSGQTIRAGQSLLTGLSSSVGRSGRLSGVLGSGLGLIPLGLRIAGLFRKKGTEPQPLSPFELPPSLSLEVANTDNILGGFPWFARKQAGEVRVLSQETPAPQPQVTVNVNAMDTQSFLDRSEDIAGALRDAMLHMHPINDVIGEM